MKKVLGHPNIVQVENFYEDKEELFTGYLVMKKAGSLDLKNLICKSEVLVDAEVLHSLSSQLINSVTRIHECGVCHRDLKPNNIML